MVGRAAGIAAGLLVLAWPSRPALAPAEDRIVTPSIDGGAAPLSVRAGDRIDIGLDLALPLTPPPGVQQPRIWSGWSVSLSREAARSVGGADKTLEYTARVLRIRPKSGARYRLVALTLPWTPRGRYDLRVRGPGFDLFSPASVDIEASEDECLVDVVVPPEVPGIEAALDGAALAPVQVAWTDDAERGRGGNRVLVFSIERSWCAAVDGGLTIARVGPGGGAKTEIRRFPDDDPVDPVASYRLVLEREGPAPVSVIWDFGDGEWGAGLEASHRWMFGRGAVVSVHAFDDAGRVFAARHEIHLREPLERRGCSCEAPGDRRPVGLGALLAALLG